MRKLLDFIEFIHGTGIFKLSKDLKVKFDTLIEELKAEFKDLEEEAEGWESSAIRREAKYEALFHMVEQFLVAQRNGLPTDQYIKNIQLFVDSQKHEDVFKEKK